MAKTMDVHEIVSGAEAECFITIAGRRYNFANAKSLEATVEKTKTQLPILGKRSKANKTTSLEYKGSATLYYNTSVLREAMYTYKMTGVDLYAEVQVTNYDPTTNIGRQTVTLLGVNFNSVVLAKFDIDSDDALSEDVEFTFEDFEMPEKFALLQSM
ncbi:MAG: phage tail tube protein [Clostridiales Family XIII bacterium]|jgi:hypothetical protein|nr:phage tail tube protein [Clostridiales Family XIII bacterium]